MDADRPLLAELHAHTTWSDGVLTPGRARRSLRTAPASTCSRSRITSCAARLGCHVRAETYPAYLDEIDAEAERARRRYGLLVLPGLELTVEHPRSAVGPAMPSRSGCASFVSVDGGLEAALSEARAAGAALIAAHPYPAREGCGLQVDSRDRLVRRASRSGPSERSTGSSSSTARSASTGSPSEAAVGCDGRLPRARAPVHVEDAAPLRAERGRRSSRRLRSARPCALMRIGTARVAA